MGVAEGPESEGPLRPARRWRPARVLWVFLATVSACSGADAPEARTSGAEPGDPEAATRSVGDLTPFQTRKAETLLRDRLSCRGCHALDGEGGTVGPDLSEVGSRLGRSGIRAAVATPRSGSIMPPIPMPERWRSLVVSYLAGRVGSEGPAGEAGNGAAASDPVPAPPTPDHGEALYQRYCAVCHGATGDGDGPNARNLPVPPTAHSDAEYMSRRPDDSLFDAVYAGGRVMNLSPRMPPFGEALTRAQIRALVDHMRTLCSCQGPEWSRDGQEGA